MWNCYSNFVRPSSLANNTPVQTLFSGEEAKRIYLEETNGAGAGDQTTSYKRNNRLVRRLQRTNNDVQLKNVSVKDLFICVQNNDVVTLRQILDKHSNILNTTDEYGWSLLMIACQANSIDVAKELVKRGINTHVRDKAGNSARSLVIKNRNIELADILLSCDLNKPEQFQISSESKIRKAKSKGKERYQCDVCNKDFPNKEEHLSSTVHNISASKGKKVPTSYVIPATNKGYQIMLKVGWDKESGLGPDGSGKKYPIKTVQKQDRKGLGLDKRKRKLQEETKKPVKHLSRKLLDRECNNSRNFEINFRREFY